MSEFQYPLATSSWDDAEYSAMQRVIDSKMFSMGPEVAAFEREFADYFGSKYSVMVNSGSSANLLMVAALFYTKENNLKPGDEVIVPAVSWSTTYNPLHQYGLKIKFVDIDLSTLNYDLEQLSEAVTDKTRLIMVVNLLGNPNDFDIIKNIIGNRDIRMIEDNCESMGAEFNERKAGTFGVMGSFSLFFSHHISTMEGGIVLTDNEELYHIMLSMRAHGWTRNLPTKNHISSKKNKDPFYESFNFILPGYNLRPLEICGAIGREQLKKLPRIINIRRKNGEIFKSLINNNTKIIIQKEIGKSSWFGFSLIIRPGADIDVYDIRKKLDKNKIEYRPIVAGNFAKNRVCEYFNYIIFKELKAANHLDKAGLFIGNHHYDCNKHLNIVAGLLNEL